MADTPPPPLLEIRQLAVEFKMQGIAVPAVKNLSLQLQPGSTLALVGESGSGKTVTSQAILGILPSSASITQGQILYTPPGQATIDIAALDPNDPRMQKIRGDQIAIIFQEPMVSLSSMHTIGNQIMEAMQLHRQCSKSQARHATLEMLKLVEFPEPERAIKRYPFELSGGLRQRAMIAMALICRPALLIADEPTTALDVTVQAQILKLIKSLQQELGMAVLLITHDLGVVANMADDLVVMYHGEVVESGPVKSLFQRPQHPYLQALFSAIPHFDMHAGERLQPIRELKPDIDHFHRLRTPWTDKQKNSGPHLCINNLSKSFGDRKQHWFSRAKAEHVYAVQDLSLDIGCGESFGLVGESGCGKTTLSKMLMRAVQPDSGKILYNDRGQMINLLNLEGEALRAFRPKMRIVFQDPFSSLNPRMTVLNILLEPMQIHATGEPAQRLQRAKELMALVGLDPRFLNRYPHSFSGGQRQRISIARALALEPELLIFDEPVSALDVSVQAQILNLLKDLQRSLGLTYLFISHNLAVVDYIADRIGVMCQGQLVEVGMREQIFRNPQHPYTQALLAAVPYPDLSRPLDFELLESNRLTDSQGWPAPYCSTLSNNRALQLIEVEPGHQVRQQPANHSERSLMS